MKRIAWALVALLVVSLLVVGAFAGGFLYSTMGGRLPAFFPGAGGGSRVGALVEQVDGIIARDALTPSEESSRVAGAISGILGSLDDTYAVYYSPSEYADLQQMQKGEFYGVGVSVGLDASGQPYATRVFPDSPAARAGIKAGDVFSAVGTIRKETWDLDQFVSLVRGPAGSTITLEVTRAGRAPFTVTVTRAKIALPNTTSEMYGKVGYVRLMTFNDLSAEELSGALAALDKKGAAGYVLDLRENPGGLLNSAVDVVSLFVDSGVAVRVDERGKPEQVLSVSGDRITTKPLVLLIDGGSASASEIVAGALKDHGRATLVGEKSYGKGSVQSVQPIGNGGAVKMTIAHYLTPDKKVINGIGVTPDVVLVMEPALQLDAKTDTQLTRALEVLRSKL